MITPLTDRVLIKPIATPDQTPSGLHLVEHAKPDVMGDVIAVPHRTSTGCPECGGVVFTLPQVQPGDTVLFGWDCGQEVLIDDERYLLIKESDLSAVLERV